MRFLLVVLLLAPWLQAVHSFGASRDGANLPSGFLFDNLPVFSDFDGDNKVDEATLSSNGGFKHIHVALGKSSWSSLSFDSNEPERGRLVSADIDEDGDIDLVWVSQNAGKFIAWLGDGRGHFSMSTDGKVHLDRIRALLGNGESRLADDTSGREIQGVLLSTNLVVVRGFEYNPHLSFEAALVAARAPAVCAPFFAVLKPRAPPSALF